MDNYAFPTYQDLTSLEDLPDPLPVSPTYLSWTLPLSFNFTFPEMELPSSCHTGGPFTVPTLEIFTGSEDTFSGSEGSLGSPPTVPMAYEVDIDLSSPSPWNTPPNSPPSKPTPTTPPSALSDQATIAESLYQTQQYDELLSYISVTYFPSSDHSYLQTLYYNSLYELYKISSGKRRLEPSRKYKLRKSNPLPSSISSVKFRSNNHFDDEVKSLLMRVFRKERNPSSETIQMLVESTALSEKQIRNFFKNKRCRG